MTAYLRSILTKAEQGQDLNPAEGVALLEARDPDSLAQIRETSDRLRQQQAGDTVTYVVNRNINFTNVCEQHCSFCAFRRDPNTEGSFWLSWEQIRNKSAEAVAQGATEICMQGGLHPTAKVDGSSLQYYLRLVDAIKTDFPELHLHAFSPQEIQFIAEQDGRSYADVITALHQAGLDSMPGTAAEVLSDRVRKIICPEKTDRATWLEIVTTALRLGVPITSTMLAGHIETAAERIEHLEQLRQIQQAAQDFPRQITEFIILPFVGETAPAPMRRRVGHDQPILADMLHLTAVARIYLGNWIPNHQPSWVKLGLAAAQEALTWGCNDIGGTLMEEHISSMAGATGGTCMTVAELRSAIASLGRPAQERTTLYGRVEQRQVVAA